MAALADGSIPIFNEDPVRHFGNVWHVLYLTLNLVMMLSVALSVVFIILGGIHYMVSGGDQKAVASARKRIMGAVIGFVIVIGAWTIRFIITSAICADPTECEKLIGG